MTPFVGGSLFKRCSQAQLEKTADRGRRFHASQIQTVRTLQLQDKHPLHVVIRRHDSSLRLIVRRYKPLRRREAAPVGRLGFPYDVTLDGRVTERATAGQAASPAVLDGSFD